MTATRPRLLTSGELSRTIAGAAARQVRFVRIPKAHFTAAVAARCGATRAGARGSGQGAYLLTLPRRPARS